MNEKEDRLMPMTSVGDGNISMVASNVHCYTNQIVNICFVGQEENWVLIDAGMPKSMEAILDVSEELFGEGAKPEAIILTHGHFDHVGAVEELVAKWDVPVYAHESELPFLTGEKAYPEPDPSVAGGLVAKMSRFFPSHPINLHTAVKKLPEDGSVPEMPGWRWIHTPGHSPGHVSLYREEDKILIAGDAFTTVKQDELFDVMTQKEEINGPPVYYTPDWDASKESVKILADLEPDYAVTGHGIPMSGEELKEGLHGLAINFKGRAIPEFGRYINNEE